MRQPVYPQPPLIIGGTVQDDSLTLSNYPEVNAASLPAQLQMFVRHCQPSSVHSARKSLRHNVSRYAHTLR